jgi:transcriptional regulator with XRE-family HTH domain
MDNRREISEFLTSRRARVRPQDSGLPSHDLRRRVPGLKREEVALLAGVSVDYYARLERGQLGGVSAAVLDAIADALRLDEAERQHLRDLADAASVPERKLRSRPPKAPSVRPSIRVLLDGMTGAPAYVRDERANILAANDLCFALYDGILDPDRLPFNWPGSCSSTPARTPSSSTGTRSRTAAWARSGAWPGGTRSTGRSPT